MPKASTERRKLNKQLSIAEFEEHNHKSEPKIKLDGSRHVLSPRFFLALVTSQAIASDPSPLQDFCVADIHSPCMHALTLRACLEARYLVQDTCKLQACQFFRWDG